MIFVDSSFFVALADRKDRYHRHALRLGKTYNKKLLVSEFVIAETVSAVGARGGSRVAGNLFEFLKESCDVEYTDARILDEAGSYFVQLDGRLSVSQCVTVAIMARKGVSKIISFNPVFDHVQGIERVH